MNYEKFEETVKGMSAKEIILTMVESLRNPVTEIDMDSFGHVSDDGICYGCAATNTICKIAGIEVHKGIFNFDDTFYASFRNKTLGHFEYAIDSLRRGNVSRYNNEALEGGFATISLTNFHEKLPYLGDDYTEEQLQVYERLAEVQ